MNTKITKTAAVLAMIIGGMAIFAGAQVLVGKIMDYYVVDWLPIYNFILGLISAGFTAIIIWKGSKFALPAAMATLASHAAVMLILQTVYRDVVAPDSIKAMTVRMVVWIIILALLFAQKRKNQLASS